METLTETLINNNNLYFVISSLLIPIGVLLKGKNCFCFDIVCCFSTGLYLRTRVSNQETLKTKKILLDPMTCSSSELAQRSLVKFAFNTRNSKTGLNDKSNFLEQEFITGI